MLLDVEMLDPNAGVSTTNLLFYQGGLMLLSRFVVCMLSGILMVLGTEVVYGQNYPNKPIRIITSLPGAGSDFTARIVGPRLSSSLGQPVVIDNRAPAVQGEIVARAPADGYTLFISGASTWTVPLLRKVPYDIVRDFSPIS